MRVERCFNIDDFRAAARRRLPAPLFHFIDGGADDEVTLRGSTSIFDECQLVPTALSDVSSIDLSTTVFGKKINWPVIMAPTGTNRLFHHEGVLFAFHYVDCVDRGDRGADRGAQVLPGLYPS
jgi:L-lactate dehydrogenase (cytochrome)